jgi:hypothetical protein
MTNVTMKSDSLEPATETAAQLFDNWFDPIESSVRERVREFIEALICGELDAALARPRYGRAKNDGCSTGTVGYRHGSRTRSLIGSFGKTDITVPRARLQTSDGRTTEWHSGFTHVTARRIAQPPKATFVTRLQPRQLPSRAARQLPDQSTTIRVASSSTGDSRLQGARPIGDITNLTRLRAAGL